MVDHVDAAFGMLVFAATFRYRRDEELWGSANKAPQVFSVTDATSAEEFTA